MKLRTLSRVLGVLGGACWAARYALDLVGSGSESMLDNLYWAGIGLLFLGLLGIGSSLVSSSAVWLQAIVGVAFPLLVWSVLEAIAPGTEPSVVDAGFGAAMVVVCLSLMVKAPPAEGRSRRSHGGAHAR